MQIDRLSMTAEDSDVVFRGECTPQAQIPAPESELEHLRMHCEVVAAVLHSTHHTYALRAEGDNFSPKTGHCRFGNQAGQIIGVYNMCLSMVF